MDNGARVFPAAEIPACSVKIRKTQVRKTMYRIFCRSQKQAYFLSVFVFLKAHSGATQLKKGEKWRKINRF
jgi:hypothetical protein